MISERLGQIAGKVDAAVTLLGDKSPGFGLRYYHRTVAERRENPFGPSHCHLSTAIVPEKIPAWRKLLPLLATFH